MKELLGFLCRTDVLIITGAVLSAIFVMKRKYKSQDMEFLDVSTIFISVLSIIAGLKLIVNNLTSDEYTTDAIFTAYGGLAIIWMTVRNVYKKW